MDISKVLRILKAGIIFSGFIETRALQKQIVYDIAYTRKEYIDNLKVHSIDVTLFDILLHKQSAVPLHVEHNINIKHEEKKYVVQTPRR